MFFTGSLYLINQEPAMFMFEKLLKKVVKGYNDK